MIKVMVVDDDPTVLEYNCRYVESIDGFKVVARAGNGQEAKKAAAEEEIELILLDIFMPGMTGVEFLSELRASGNLVDVIFLTAAKDTDMINRAIKLGLFDYLIKPFSYERFKEAMENYARFHKTLYRSDMMTQKNLDELIRSLPNPEGSRIVKGMHRQTMDDIRNYVQSRGRETITQQELADRLKLSRVTVRRYMEYLVSTNEVVIQIEYGSKGRPSYTYKRLM